MNNYAQILSALRFTLNADGKWYLYHVMDNDIVNYATYEGNRNGGLHFGIYGPDEPPACKYIIVTILENTDQLKIYFDYDKSGHTERVMPLSYFENIFTKLLQDKRESQINKIL